MKRRLFVLLIACVILTMVFSSCVKSKALIEYGEEVIALMAEAAGNEDYIALHGGLNAFDKMIDGINAGDYSEIKAVYELVISEDKLFNNMGDMSLELNSYIGSKTYTSFANVVNNRSGENAIAVSSVLAIEKSFVCDKGVDTVYLYVFENGKPITVAFVSDGDGVIRAVGNFIMNEEFVSDIEKKDGLSKYGLSEARRVDR